MSVSFRFDGLADLIAQFNTLPEDLTVAAAPDVETAARGSADTIRAGYPIRTGNLRDHVSVSTVREGMRVKAIVVNTSPHAVIFERGTQARHTAIGANRGSMPANPLFTATIIRDRRRLLSDPLPDVLRAFGLQVELRGG